LLNNFLPDHPQSIDSQELAGKVLRNKELLALADLRPPDFFLQHRS
jgi:hypothetical protein